MDPIFKKEDCNTYYVDHVVSRADITLSAFIEAEYVNEEDGRDNLGTIGDEDLFVYGDTGVGGSKHNESMIEESMLGGALSSGSALSKSALGNSMLDHTALSSSVIPLMVPCLPVETVALLSVL